MTDITSRGVFNDEPDDDRSDDWGDDSQDVPPLPDNDVDTKELPIVRGPKARMRKSKGNAAKEQRRRQHEQRSWPNGEREHEGTEGFFTRHHWREPLIRLLSSRLGPWYYLLLFRLGLSLILTPTLILLTSADATSVWKVEGVLFIAWLAYLLVRKLFVWVKMYTRRRKRKKSEKELEQGEEVPTEKLRPLNPGEATSISILRGCLSFIVVMVIPVLLYFGWPQYWGTMFIIGVLSVSLSVFREWYRWRDLTILILRTARGFVFTFGEPKNAWLGFIGTAVGPVSFLEGSVEVESFISLADKYIFQRCGDVKVTSKIEGNNTTYLDSIPDMVELQEFLIKPLAWGNAQFD